MNLLQPLFVCLCFCQGNQPHPNLLPSPTGIHKTARMSFHWKDESRDELETAAPDDKRELMVHLFYPADASASGERAVYVPDADAMKGPWNDEQIARIQSMRAYSIENTPLPKGDAKYPVVLFSPGGGMKALTYHALLEDLASHGWVVAAIDPPYNAKGVRFPDGRVLGNLKQNERGWPEPKSQAEYIRFYTERIAHWCRDISFVIDQLVGVNEGDGPFAKRLDLERGVGAFGHSRGGQAAGSVRIVEPRVRGGINLDGSVGPYPVIPIKDENDSGAQPFLWIQRSLPPPPAEEQLKRARRTRAEYDAEVEKVLTGWRTRLGTIAGGAMWVTMNRPGIEHIDFSDEPFWDGTMTDENRPGRLQTIADTRAWVRAFFDGTVRGEWEDMKRLSSEPKSDVNVEVFGKMDP